MNPTKIMLNIALCSSVVSSSFLYCADTAPKPDNRPFLNTIQANIKEIAKNPLKRYPLLGGIAFLGTSVYLLFDRESKPDAKPRHDWKKVIDTKLLQSNPSKFVENLKYIFMDAWIGQRLKEKHMEVTKEKTIKQSEACRPFGILGVANAKLFTFKKSTDMVKDFATLAGGIGGVVYLINRPEVVEAAFNYLIGEKLHLKKIQLTPDQEYKTRRDLGEKSEDIVKDMGIEFRHTKPNKPLPEAPAKENKKEKKKK
jgi:hypothetical protein